MARHITRMTIHDAQHYSNHEREKIIAAYPAHEREARAFGVPVLGSGRVFTVSENQISCDPMPIPNSWPMLGAIDFGWDHPTAAVLLAWDRDRDCVYVTRAYRVRRATPTVHCKSLTKWGDIPWAWPHDGLQHSKDSGKPLAEQYRKAGLCMMNEPAKWPDGSNGVEAGLIEMLERMQSGRFKVFSNLTEWFDEFRIYHRKDGKLVKLQDDLMAATRYGIMCLRFARTLERKTRAAQAVSEYDMFK